MWTVATTATLVALLARSSYLFSIKIYADGDFAANAILIDKALRWQLLSGNYSRVGFRHPGPGFLYVEAWSEWLLHDVLGAVPTPFNAHVIGVLVLNAVLLGAVAHLFYVHQRSAAVTVAGFAAAAIFLASQPYALSFVWMPYVYVAPFLLFATAVASFAVGRWASLPWLVFSGGLLVHGHVSFLGFVGPAGLLLVVVTLLRHRRDRAGLAAIGRDHMKPIAVSGVLAGLFALPIAINVIWNFPADFGRYLSYVRSGQAGHHSVASVIRYGLEYWGAGAGRHVVAAVLVVAALGLALADARSDARRFGIAAVATAGALSALFLNYGLRGIDDLSERYIGQFYVAVPALVLAVLAMGATHRVIEASTRWRRGATVASAATAAAAILAMAGTAATVDALTHPYRGDPRIPALHDALQNAPDRAGAPVVMTFSTATWPLPTGLMYYGRHNGVRVCAADELWEFLVTDEFVCSSSERRRGWRLDVAPATTEPEGPAFYQDDRVTITAP